MDLRQPRFTYNAFGPFTKHCKMIKKFKEASDLSCIISTNELDNACFAHDAAYTDVKDLTKRTVSDKTLKDRA